MQKRPCVAVVLAAGNGKRMGGPVAKQFLEVNGKPLIFYALDTMETSKVIDQVVLVVPEESIEYVKKEILEKYSLNKVVRVVAGGKERYDSVRNALRFIEKDTYIFIHDGARALVSEEILKRGLEQVEVCGACVAAVPVKDTIKRVDQDGFAVETPERSTLWTVQTPQVFAGEIIKEAYEALPETANVTDDAGVVEWYGNAKVKMYLGDYTNLKVTTPEDMILMKSFLKK